MASLCFAEGFAMLRQTTRQRVNKTTSGASLRCARRLRRLVVYKKSNQKKQKESTRSLVVSLTCGLKEV